MHWTNNAGTAKANQWFLEKFSSLRNHLPNSRTLNSKKFHNTSSLAITQYDRSVSNGQKLIFYYLIIVLKNTTFGSFLTFYYVLHHIFHANLRISENKQFFEVLTFSLFLRIELFDLEKSLNFQIFKKVFGTMLEYINTDTTNA